MSNPRTGFILLDTYELDFEKFKRNLEDEWGIAPEEEVSDDNFVFKIEDMLIGVGLIKGKVPNNEAEENAKNNYLWKDAVEVTKNHKAHVILSVINGNDPLKISLTFSVVATSLLRLDNAIGIYQMPTVLSPEFYIESTESIKKDELPILNWVYIGIYPDEKGFSGYTIGLEYFNKKEIEVINTKESPDKLYEFLLDISNYIIESNAELLDGQTIGFSEEEKLEITESKGKVLDGNTIKIAF